MLTNSQLIEACPPGLFAEPPEAGTVPRESQEYFRLLTENCSDIITILEADGRIRYESPSVERVLGFKPEERIGTHIATHVHPDDAATAREGTEKSARVPGSVVTFELRVRHKEGGWRTLEIAGTNLLGDRRVQGMVGNARDVTERRQAEAEVRRLYSELSLAYETTLEGWVAALDLRDKETEGHTQRVTEMTLRVAGAMGFAESELVQVRRGALLHDIGKVGIPDAILLKPDKLTDEEWQIMRRHPTYAFELLSPIAYLRPALDIPYSHHEKWDGTGYPRGLKGLQIPLAARLFAVVDVWDALRSDRPYRAGWPEEKVLEHIRSLSGTHFEPAAVEVFLRVAREAK